MATVTVTVTCLDFDACSEGSVTARSEKRYCAPVREAELFLACLTGTLRSIESDTARAGAEPVARTHR